MSEDLNFILESNVVSSSDQEYGLLGICIDEALSPPPSGTPDVEPSPISIDDFHELNFIQDLWYANVDDITNKDYEFSSDSKRICSSLEKDNNDLLIFSANNSSGFFFKPDIPPVLPEGVIVNARVSGNFSEDFALAAYINNTKVLHKNFYTSDTVVSGFIEKQSVCHPDEDEYKNLISHIYDDRLLSKTEDERNRLTVRTSAPSGEVKLESLRIFYSGSSFNNSYISSTPDTFTIFPKTLESFLLYPAADTTTVTADTTQFTADNTINYTIIDAYPISGLTNSSGSDHNWISGVYDDLHIDRCHEIEKNSLILNFDSLDFFDPNNHTRQIDRCIFSMRYRNASGDDTNIQSFCPVRIRTPKLSEKQIAFGSGFHLNNTSSWERVETEINFHKDDEFYQYFNTSDLFHEFNLELQHFPRTASISATQLDFYLSNDDVLSFALPAEVYHKREEKIPSSNKDYSSIGFNRTKSSGDDEELFNVTYNNLNPNTTIDINYESSFWKSYYEELINTYEFHNHNYKNSLYLASDNYIVEPIDTTNDYAIFLHVSTSGNFPYVNSSGDILRKVDEDNNLEFKLSTDGTDFKFLFYHNNTPEEWVFQGHYNNMIVITKEAGLNDTLVFYNMEQGDNSFRHLESMSVNNIKSSIGNLYIGGSGVNDFHGYIHEYGISDNFFGDNSVSSSGLLITELSNSRNKLSQSLSEGKTLLLNNNYSGEVNDIFDIVYDNPQVSHPQLVEYNSPHIFAYNTWLNNSNPYRLKIDYTLNTSGSDISISGVYRDSRYRDNEILSVDFIGTLSNGSGTTDIPVSSYSSIFANIEDRKFNGIGLRNHLQSDSGSFDLEIRDIKIDFDGWFNIEESVEDISFVTSGRLFEDNSFNMFLPSLFESNDLDFYTYGKDVESNSFDLFIDGKLESFSSVDFYTEGGLGADDSLDFYISTTSEISDSLNMFIDGKVPSVESGSIDFSLVSTTEESIFEPIDFYINSEIDDANVINFYINSSNFENEDSINLFTFSEQVSSKSFDMIVYNINESDDFNLNFNIQGTYSEDGSVNLFTDGS